VHNRAPRKEANRRKDSGRARWKESSRRREGEGNEDPLNKCEIHHRALDETGECYDGRVQEETLLKKGREET